MDGRGASLSLACRVQTRLIGLPLAQVIETMRPLPTEVVAGAPHFVRGLAMIRGAPVPVVDAARLLGVQDAPSERFVTLAVGLRRVALAVGSVLGVRAVAAESLHRLPPLLQDASADVVSAIGRLDAELLLVLNGARLLPDEAWPGAGMASGAAA